MSSHQAPYFTDDDGTTTGALTPTSTVGGSLADLHLTSSPDEDFERKVAEIHDDIANIRHICDTALQRCDKLEGTIRKLAEAHSSATSDTLTAFSGKLLPPLDTSMKRLRDSLEWTQRRLPHKAYRDESGLPIADTAVWDALDPAAQAGYERQVQGMVTEALDDVDFDPEYLGEKASEVLLLIATLSALMDLHPVRDPDCECEDFWGISIPDLDKQLNSVHSAWEDLSRPLFTLRSHKVGSSAVLFTTLTTLKAFPRISLSSKPDQESMAIRDSLLAGESLHKSMRTLAAMLHEEKDVFGKV